jgi:hypothetical protein
VVRCLDRRHRRAVALRDLAEGLSALHAVAVRGGCAPTSGTSVARRGNPRPWSSARGRRPDRSASRPAAGAGSSLRTLPS